MYEVLAPGRHEIIDHTLIEQIMRDRNLEYCPLCRKIVHNDIDRKGCGWFSSKESKCMKLLFEENLTSKSS